MGYCPNVGEFYYCTYSFVCRAVEKGDEKNSKALASNGKANL